MFQPIITHLLLLTVNSFLSASSPCQTCLKSNKRTSAVTVLTLCFWFLRLKSVSSVKADHEDSSTSLFSEFATLLFFFFFFFF